MYGRIGSARRVSLVLLLASCAFAPLAARADTAWVPTDGNGNWFDGDSWSNGVPNAVTVLTTVASGGTVTVNGGAANAGATLAIGGSSTVSLTGGSLSADNIAFSDDGALSLRDGATLTSGTHLSFNGGLFSMQSNTVNIGALSGVGLIQIAGGALTLDQAADTTFNGSLNGDGSFRKAGAGTLVLGGAYHLTGGLFIDAGTLAFAGILAGSGPITLGGGTLESRQSDNSTFSGVIDGAGNLVVNNTAVLALTGANTFSGGIQLLGGTLAVAADANLGNANNGLTFGAASGPAGGTLRLDASFDLAATRAVTLNATGGTIDTNGFSTTIAQAIAGGGKLTKAGEGTLTLVGANTYSGGTLIGGGNLIVGNNGTLGTGAVVDNATLTFNDGNSIAASPILVANAISGTGAVVQSGIGATFFTGVNSYSGTTTITKGALVVGNGGTTGTLGAGTVIVTDALLAFNRSNALTVANVIAGNGSLQQYGSGLVTLTGVNSYSGSTVVGGGGLAVAGNANLGSTAYVELFGAAPLKITGTSTFTQNILLSASSVIDVAATKTATWQGVLSNGQRTTAGTPGSGSPPPSQAPRGDDSSSSFVVIGGGVQGALNLSGGGTLILSATNTYTGATAVNAGTLIVNGSIAASSGVSVASGATLGGAGTVSALSVASGGTVAPGNSGLGTLNVGGVLTIPSGATYALDVSHTTADKIAASGAAILGGNLTLAVSALPSAGAHFTILTAGGGVSGTLHLTGAPSIGAVVPTLQYDLHNVYLNYGQVLLSANLPSGADENTQALAGGIDKAIVAGDTLPQGFLDLGALTPAGLGAKAPELMGDIGAALPGIGAAQTNAFLTVLMNQPGDLDTDIGIPAPSAQRSAMASLGNPAGGVAAPLQAARRSGSSASLWLSGFDGHGNATADIALGTHETRSNTIGFAGGVDMLIARGFVVGVAAADGHTNFALTGTSSTGDADTLQFGLYATDRFGPLYFSFGGAYAMQDLATLRTITGLGAGVLTAKVRATAYTARLETGYRIRTKAFGMTPYLAAQTSSFHTPAYAETAASGSSIFALSFAQRTQTATRFEAGLGIDTAARLTRNVALHLYGRAAYAHSSGAGNTADVSFSALPGSDFVIQGAGPGSNTALLSVAAELRGRNGLSLGLKAEAEASQHYTGYFGTLDLRYSW